MTLFRVSPVCNLPRSRPSEGGGGGGGGDKKAHYCIRGGRPLTIYVLEELWLVKEFWY